MRLCTLASCIKVVVSSSIFSTPKHSVLECLYACRRIYLEGNDDRSVIDMGVVRCIVGEC